LEPFLVKTFLLSLAGAFCALILFVMIGFMFIGGMIGAATASPKQASDLILTLDLREGVPDQAPTGGFAALNNPTGFIDITRKLRAAETDDDVRGIYIRGSEFGIGSSRAEELRNSLNRLKANGKFVIAHSQGLFGTGPSGLRAISAADEIYIQPGTDVMTSGISFETQFLKEMFDKFSLQAEIIQFHEYKNSPNQYKQTTYTEPHREAMTALGESIWTVSLEDIAEDRKMPIETVRALLEGDPASAEAMVEAGLLNELGWPEDAKKAAEDKVGEDANFLSVSAYQPPTAKAGAPIIAVVGGEGAIITGSGASGPFSSPAFGSDRVAQAILDAADNERVNAIVFRVDSPGGSPTASDQVWNAVHYAKEKGKPVIVSMGSLAASGGYYVSANASHIVANKSTITGSIGIFGGKITIDGGLDRIGINTEEITVGGEFANAWGTDAFTPTQTEQLRASLQRGYDRFIGHVAAGRMEPLKAAGKTASELAKGRVWSGEDALERGLVDSIGGFMDAVDVAVEKAGLEEGTSVRLLTYPKRDDDLVILQSLLGASAQTAEASSRLNTLLSDPQISATLQQLQALQSGQTQVSITPFRER